MKFQRSKTDIHSLPRVAKFRTKLRKNLTPAEAAFWKLVKNSQLDGRKFRRQHSIGNYIFDFYCPSEKLAIELDGEGHFVDYPRLNDRSKREFAESHGIRVIRFENKRCLKTLNGYSISSEVTSTPASREPPRQPKRLPPSFVRRGAVFPDCEMDDR